MSNEEFERAASEKCSKLQGKISELSTRLQRALTNVRTCRQACQDTSKDIGEFNGNIVVEKF
jgi:molecular chaperone GrpE (heat shock protein)